MKLTFLCIRANCFTLPQRMSSTQAHVKHKYNELSERSCHGLRTKSTNAQKLEPKWVMIIDTNVIILMQTNFLVEKLL